MTVSRTTSGRWRARLKVGRRGVASRTFDRKSDAAAWLAAQKRALALGDFVDPRAGRETVGAALQRWRVARNGTVASKTYREEGYALRKIPATLLNRPVGAVRPSDLDSLFSDMVRAGLARSSVSRFRNTVSSFFGWAVRERIIARNPAIDSRVPRGMGTEHRAEVYPFALAELHAVHADISGKINDRDAADIVLVLGLTGLRWGELSALRVRDVQMVPYPALRVSRSRPDGHAVRTVTKGGSARTVPLVGDVVAIVGPLAEGRAPEEPLFPNRAGHMRLLSNWKRAVHWDRNGRGRRVHDLRHTAATLWLTSGVDAKTVQNWLGHSTAKLTLDTYGHWLGTDADAAAIARLEAAWGDAGETRVPNLRTVKGRASQ